MSIIDVNESNIDREHICCAITDKKGESCVSSKKEWMCKRFDDGLMFKKLDVRGKVFIEYIPAERAWAPIDANGYMYINCLWVSGKYQGQGYANALLDECIMDAKSKEKDGLVILSAAKKKPFLADPGFLRYKGFTVCDTAQPFFQLLYLPFSKGAIKPRFKECCRTGRIAEKEMVLYYTNQCPFTEKYAPLIAGIARDRGAGFSLHRIETMEAAQSAPSPFTTYGFFYDGAFVTNEIFSGKKFSKFLDEIGM
jgi:ribosomal protein S18 acetylase RimI-like enzyme